MRGFLNIFQNFGLKNLLNAYHGLGVGCHEKNNLNMNMWCGQMSKKDLEKILLKILKIYLKINSLKLMDAKICSSFTP